MPVEAGADGDTLISIAQTDSEGRYRLERVPPGRYLIAAGAVDSPTYFPGVTNRNQGQVVTIAAGQTIASLDFAMAFANAPPQLWGRVEFDDGSPLPVGTLNQILLILSSDSAHWTTKPFTNQQGLFFFQSFVPGEYSLTLAPLPLGYGYLKSMTFGNVDLVKGPLTLTDAPNVAEVRIVLTKTRPAGVTPGVKVSGRVTNRAPLVLNALTRVLDQVHPGDVTNAVAYVSPREDGSFEIQGVPPGRYMIGPAAGKAHAALEVAGSDVTNVVLDASVLTPGLPVILSSTARRSITGTVEVANGGTIPNFEIRFATTRANPPTTHTASVAGKDFGIYLPDGEYRVTVSGLPDGYSVESIKAGPLDLTYPFLITSRGIADRFTGNPILVKPAGAVAAISAGITVRLKAPPLEK
jgi:protocatechuate 3,4-dioxygenase beta subunit